MPLSWKAVWQEKDLKVLADKMNMNQPQIRLMVFWTALGKVLPRWPLPLAQHLECSVQIWAPNHKRHEATGGSNQGPKRWRRMSSAWGREGSGELSSMSINTWKNSAERKEPGSSPGHEALGTNHSTGGSLTTQSTNTFECAKCLSTVTGCTERLWNLQYQKLPRHGPGPPAPSGSSWAGSLDIMASRGSPQPQPVCDPALPTLQFYHISAPLCKLHLY